MEGLNPIQNEFTKYIADISKRLGNIEKARQGQWLEWYEFPVTSFSYVSDNVISASDQSTLGFIQIGDKVKLTQGTTKYFYVIGKSGSNITITGGSDYTFTNTAITYIATSKLASPTGHPIIFNYTSTLKTWDSALTISNQGTWSGYFRVDGQLLTVWINRKNYTLSGVADYYLIEDLPITWEASSVANRAKYISATNSIMDPGIAGSASISAVNASDAASASGNSFVEISKSNFALITTGTHSHYVTYVYQYYVP